MKRGYRRWTPAEKRAAVAQMAVCGHGKIAAELGISTAPKKSTLAYANANPPWELYESVFMQLLEK